MMSTRPEVNVVPHPEWPNVWVVEHVDADGDGGIAVTIFEGCEPKERAENYAALLRAAPLLPT
jgi:hypothetical protein